MDAISDAIIQFFQSGLGIALQIALFIGALIPLMKYLGDRFDRKVDANIDKKLAPLVKGFCDQLTIVSGTLSTFQAQTNTAIKYINDAIENIQNMQLKNHNKNQNQNYNRDLNDFKGVG